MMKTRKILLLIATLFIGVASALGQAIQVKGVVLDENNDPIIGATVRLKSDASVGAATNFDGEFTLRVPNGAILLFSYVGYQNQEVPASSNMRVQLRPDSEVLEELVVTAYGVQKKSSLTGSIASVGSEKLEKLPGSDALKSMEGVLAGVSVSNPTGAPGEDTRIRIRGIGSFAASSSPLIILDGAPYEGGFNTINPNDIESINVLKDAASAALYGARGANGVILVQTKSGREGRTSVSFDMKIGRNYRGIPEYDIITDPGQYYELSWQSLYNYSRRQNTIPYIEEGKEKVRPGNQTEAGQWASQNLWDKLGGYAIYKGVGGNEIVLPNGKLNPKATEYIFENPSENLDWNGWYDALFSPQWRQEYNLSVSRGTDKSKTFFSLGYLTDKGYSANSYFNRITARLNHSSDLYKWLRFSNNIQFSATDRNMNSGGGLVANPFYFTRAMAPIHPIYKYNGDGTLMKDIDGNLIYEDGAAIDGVSKDRSELKNNNVVLTQSKNLDRNENYILNNTANLTILLPYNFSLAVNATYTGEFYYATYRQYPFGDAKMFNGRIRKMPEYQHGFNINQILERQFLNDDLDIAVKFGHETYRMKHGYMEGARTNLLDVDATEMNWTGRNEFLTSYAWSYRLEGFFSQFTATLLDRYNFSLSGRMDGSSVFHPDHRWGAFWSTGLSWNIAQEEFFAPARSWADELKLRVSYGLQGNDYLLQPNYVYRDWTPYVDTYEVVADGTNYSIKPLRKGNEEITWEKNHNFNVALDFSFLGRRLNGSLELFQRTTSDMLFNLPISSSTGFSTKPVNVGSMKNTGFELSLNAVLVDLEKVRWSIDGNITHYKNVVTKLPDYAKETGIRIGKRLIEEGKSIYNYSTVKYAGVDPETGTSLFELRKSEDEPFQKMPWDASLQKTSYQDIGSSLPDLQGGFGTSLMAYGFDLSLQFAFGIGGMTWDSGYSLLMDPSSMGTGRHKDLLNSWSETNNIKNTDVPRLELNNRDLSGSESDKYYTDASHLAFRSITFGYSLPKSILKDKLSAVRIYGLIDNVHLWSKRQGFDPRISVDASGDYAYSPIRTVSLGLSVNF